MLCTKVFEVQRSERKASACSYISQKKNLRRNRKKKKKKLWMDCTKSVQSLSHVQQFVTPWTTAHKASLSIKYSQSLPKLMSTELVIPSNHFTLCHPLRLLPSIFPSIRVFSNESALRIRWPKYWSFTSTSVLPMNIQDWSLLGWTDWISL